MKTKQLAQIIITIFAGLSASAYADVTVYGRAHVGVQHHKVDGSDSETKVESYSSRFGLSSDHKISDGLTAFAKFEWEVAASEQDKETDNLKARNQYVGLKGSFGEVVLGREDTAMKKSQGKFDQMNDFNGDIKQLFNGENRLGDVVRYSSPKLGQLQFIVTYVAEENDKQNGDDGLSAAITYGDKDLKKSAFYVSYAHDSKVAGYDIDRVTAQGKLGDFTIGGMYQQSDKVDSDSDGDGYAVNASYKINDYKLMVQYQDTDMTFGKLKDSGTASSIGVERKLSKQTKMYVWYTQHDLDNAADQDNLAVTLRYDF